MNNNYYTNLLNRGRNFPARLGVFSFRESFQLCAADWFALPPVNWPEVCVCLVWGSKRIGIESLCVKMAVPTLPGARGWSPAPGDPVNRLQPFAVQRHWMFLALLVGTRVGVIFSLLSKFTFKTGPWKELKTGKWIISISVTIWYDTTLKNKYLYNYTFQ